LEDYIVLCNFDRAELSRLLGDEDTSDRAKKLLEEVGGSLEAIWLTAGVYDLVAHIRAPDIRRALTFLAAFSSVSNVRTTTLTAVEGEGISQVFKDAADARTKIGEG
jgi:uncharacterized protein with GYD domain